MYPEVYSGDCWKHWLPYCLHFFLLLTCLRSFWQVCNATVRRNQDKLLLETVHHVFVSRVRECEDCLLSHIHTCLILLLDVVGTKMHISSVCKHKFYYWYVNKYVDRIWHGDGVYLKGFQNTFNYGKPFNVGASTIKKHHYLSWKF